MVRAAPGKARDRAQAPASDRRRPDAPRDYSRLMPELPEVECVRRSIEAGVLGRRVEGATVHRRDALCREGEPFGGWSRLGHQPRPTRFTRVPRTELGVDRVVRAVHRHGKQLAIELAPDRAILVHLGMTGQLIWRDAGGQLPKSDHIHVTWRLGPRSGADSGGRLVFRDPRRFGGVWLYPSLETLAQHRWAGAGADALKITGAQLRAGLSRYRRPIKAALLDQGVIAGVGNIYADEALHKARLSPEQPAVDLSTADVDRLRKALRAVLTQAIKSGGSTLRDYTDGAGRAGAYQSRHSVYGRGGEPCQRCGATLSQATVAQRTTVWCPSCQPLRAT